MSEWQPPDQARHQFALLRVCREILRETVYLPLTLNTFYFTQQPLGSKSWKRLPLKQKERIKRVRLALRVNGEPGHRFFLLNTQRATKQEGTAEFGFPRVLSGLKYIQLVFPMGFDPKDNKDMKTLEEITSELRAAVDEGVALIIE